MNFFQGVRVAAWLPFAGVLSIPVTILIAAVIYYYNLASGPAVASASIQLYAVSAAAIFGVLSWLDVKTKYFINGKLLCAASFAMLLLLLTVVILFTTLLS